jgi:ElaB/YqjD/DUF883 family membrane-anchored ribosome-binding protein
MTTTNEHYKRMNKEMQNIIDHAHALVEATSGEIDDRVKEARSALKERLDSAKGECGALEDQLLVKVQAADEFIHVKPYYAIGGSLIAGLFLGWFMSRK